MFFRESKRASSLGAFAKLQKKKGGAPISSVVPVCLSVRLSVCVFLRMEQLGSNWMDFYGASTLRAK